MHSHLFFLSFFSLLFSFLPFGFSKLKFMLIISLENLPYAFKCFIELFLLHYYFSLGFGSIGLWKLDFHFVWFIYLFYFKLFSHLCFDIYIAMVRFCDFANERSFFFFMHLNRQFSLFFYLFSPLL